MNFNCLQEKHICDKSEVRLEELHQLEKAGDVFNLKVLEGLRRELDKKREQLLMLSLSEEMEFRSLFFFLNKHRLGLSSRGTPKSNYTDLDKYKLELTRIWEKARKARERFQLEMNPLVWEVEQRERYQKGTLQFFG